MRNQLKNMIIQSKFGAGEKRQTFTVHCNYINADEQGISCHCALKNGALRLKKDGKEWSGSISEEHG